MDASTEKYPEFPELMKFHQAVRYTGVTKYTFRKWRRDNLFSVIGGTTGHPRYRKSELRKLKKGSPGD